IVLAVGSEFCETVNIDVDPNLASTSVSASSSKRQSSDVEYEPTPKKSKGTMKIGSRAVQNLDIRSLLLEDNERGPPVLQYFNTFKTFTKTHRDVLTAIVVTAARAVKEDLKNDDFSILSDKIADAFPGESPFTYYLAPYAEGKSQSISKGKLPVRYRNVLKREKELAGKSSSAVRQPRSQNNKNPYDNVTCVVISKEMNDAFLWLETNSLFDDWPLIKSKWRLSAPLRLQQLFKDETDSIANYLNKWPLELDFDCIYPDKGLNLITNWNVFVETIIQLASKSLTDPVAKDCLALANTVTHWSKGVLALNILPALCPPTTLVKGVKGTEKRRLLLSNSRAGLLLHVA
ncbi:tRNA pseudouridine synthase B, partial [Frankliniella fusca]